MKKMFFVGLLVLASSSVSAGLLGSVNHDYGIGMFDPGGNDLLTTNSVIVSDQSTGRFNDVFDFSGISGTISSLELVLDFAHAGPSCPWGFCSIGETWEARLQGSNGSAQNDDLFINISDVLSPQSMVLTSATDTGSVDVWAHSLSQSSLALWFSEGSWQEDSFALNSATLNVHGDSNPISVPEPASAALLGLGLVGVYMSRRRRTGSTVIS